jgi:hypothetical protein
MTTMKTLAAAALLAAPVLAAAAPGELDGTWACRTPGVDHGNTPPILHLGLARGSETAIDVDGFARSVFGIGDVVADAGGWYKVTPPQGPAFLVRPEAGRAMIQVRYNGADWRCHRVQPRTT